MESYDYMSFSAIDAMIDEQAVSGKPYEMSLNQSEFTNLVRALAIAYDSDKPDISDWAGDFLSSVAITLGIEMI